MPKISQGKEGVFLPTATEARPCLVHLLPAAWPACSRRSCAASTWKRQQPPAVPAFLRCSVFAHLRDGIFASCLAVLSCATFPTPTGLRALSDSGADGTGGDYEPRPPRRRERR